MALRSFVPLLLLVAATACDGGAATEDAASADAVTAIPSTSVRNQGTTSNCWLYATGAWIESLELAERVAEGQGNAGVGHLSVAYWDYWDWYLKVTQGAITAATPNDLFAQLDSGGTFGHAFDLVLHYGVVDAGSFAGSDAEEAQTVQSAAMRLSAELLAGGRLHTPASRRDKALVRTVLDDVFALATDRRDALRSAFGDGSRTFGIGNARPNAIIRSPNDIQVRLPRADGTYQKRTLTDAVGRPFPPGTDKRTGDAAWQPLEPLWADAAGQREWLRRVQRALNAGVPVPILWYVPSSVDPQHTGVYRTSSIDDPPVGSYHLTVITDYEVTNVPGLGRLPAGVPATPAQMNASLANDAQVVFFRVKNSWGDREAGVLAPSGYNDLYLDFLFGSATHCPPGQVVTDASCWTTSNLSELLLPAGF